MSFRSHFARLNEGRGWPNGVQTISVANLEMAKNEPFLEPPSLPLDRFPPSCRCAGQGIRWTANPGGVQSTESEMRPGGTYQISHLSWCCTGIINSSPSICSDAPTPELPHSSEYSVHPAQALITYHKIMQIMPQLHLTRVPPRHSSPPSIHLLPSPISTPLHQPWSLHAWSPLPAPAPWASSGQSSTPTHQTAHVTVSPRTTTTTNKLPQISSRMGPAGWQPRQTSPR